MGNARLDTLEAARVLRLSPGTLEVWRSKGRGPRFRKIGAKVFYDIDDLEEFANAYVVETADSLSSEHKMRVLKRREENRKI